LKKFARQGGTLATAFVCQLPILFEGLVQRAAFRDIFDFANTLEELTEDKTSGLEQAGRMAEQLRDQQIQQQYSDQLVVYVQEKAEQIDRLQSSLAAVLTSEQAQLQAIQQRPPGWTAAKKRARSMGAAGCATKYQDRADCASFGEGRGD
jgi:hypothetical protein